MCSYLKLTLHKFENNQSVKITKDLYLSDEMADVFFAFYADNGKIRVPAHKLILAAGSDAFKAMFYGDLKEEGDIEIKDVSINGFKEFLQFFYLDKVSLTIDNIAEVMDMTHKYLMSNCHDICDTFLKCLPIQNVCFTYELALIYGRIELVEFCEQEIRAFTEDVLRSDGFTNCSKQILERILRMDYLDCYENQVFNACMEWAKNACKKADEDPLIEDNLRKHLGDSFHLIQFSLMKKASIYDCVQSYRKLFTRDELLELLDIIMSENKEPPELRLFNCKTRKLSCDIEFDNSDGLYADSSDSSSESDFSVSSGLDEDIKRHQVTQFYTNQGVFLLAIETGYIPVHNISDDLSAVLHVVRNNGDILLEQNINFLKDNTPDDGIEIFAYVKLLERISIEPRQLYEIRIKFNSLGDEENAADGKHKNLLDVSRATDGDEFKVISNGGGIIQTFYFDNVTQ